jgi:small subunit ribosomal protein S8
MDPIADMINKIKNAQAVSKEMVKVPYSNFKYEIAKILEKEKWIGKVEKKGKIPLKFIEIKLKYEKRKPLISKVKRVSRPGRRIYSSVNEIKKVMDGRGMSIISTPKGLMTGKDAKKQKQGGEILFEIW